jgi:Lrp/AsnC family transcriptional regulator
MDRIDYKILTILQSEPDLNITEIGKRVGLSHTPCWRRIKQMQDQGVIAGRSVILNPASLNLDVCVFCFVKLTNHQENTLMAFENAVLKLPDVLQCYSITGDYDYVLRVVTSDIRHYEKVLKRKLINLPNVAFVNSSFTLREVKNTTSLPLEEF